MNLAHGKISSSALGLRKRRKMHRKLGKKWGICTALFQIGRRNKVGPNPRDGKEIVGAS